MKKKTAAMILAALGFFAGHAYETTVGGTGSEKAKDVMPVLLSNGRLSVLVDEKLSVPDMHTYDRFAYTNSIVWEGRRQATPRYALYPHGRFRPVVKMDGKELGEPLRWSQTLDTHGAETRIVREYAGGVKVIGSAFVALSENVISLRLEVTGGGTPEIDLGFSLPEDERLFPTFKDGRDLKRMRMKSFGRYVTDTGIDIVCVRPSPGVAEFHLVFADTQEKDKSPMEDRLAAATASVRSRGWEGIRAKHRKEWAAFHGASRVTVPDERYTRMREMALYQLRCSVTEWSIPVGMTPGMWEGTAFAFDEMYAVQGLLSSGNFAEGGRATEFRFDTLRDAHGRNGSWGWHNYRNGHSFGARWVWQSLEDTLLEGSRPGFWRDHIFHMAAIARSAYLQYRFTDDKEYLRKKSYPIIIECARFFRWLWVYDDRSDGTAFIGKCTDLERLGPGRERACLTTCGVIHNFRIAAECAKILDVDREEAEVLLDLADRLERGMAVKDGVFVPHPGAKENSMGTLGGYFPFPIFKRGHETMMRTVEKFLSEGASVGNMYKEGKRVCPWYAATMSIAAGMTGNRKTPGLWVEEALRSAGVWGEFWEINEPGVTSRRPWFMTAAANTLYAYNRLFVADADGEIRVAFSVPEGWQDYSFDLPAERGIRVKCEVKNGKIVSLTLSARNAANAKDIRLRFRADMLDGEVPGSVKVKAREERDGEVLVVCDIGI